MLLLLGALIVMGIIELFVMIQVASVIGAVATVLAIVLCSAAGAWVVKLQGFGAWVRVSEAVAQGRMPTNELIDAFLVLIAGTLLLVPGFVSGAVGLFLAVPPLRALFRQPLASVVQSRVSRRLRIVGSVYGQRPGAGRGFGSAGFPGYGTGGSAGRSRGDGDDIIDLDSEEVFIDEPLGELPPNDEQ